MTIGGKRLHDRSKTPLRFYISPSQKQTYHYVILSIAKDLYASTSAFQILHSVQNDKNK